MSELPSRRRDPYPGSPEIGPDGIRAVQEMVDAARRLFREQGYHGTSTTRIAVATGRSDAAFYQYFDGKLTLFQMLYEELGAKLARHFERFPELSDTPVAAEDLAAWLRGLAEVVRPYSPGLLVWPLPSEEVPASGNPQEIYFERFVTIVSTRLDGAELGAVQPRTFVVTVVALVAWSHVLLEAGTWASGQPPADAAAVDDVLARVLHRSLFPVPDVPRSVVRRTTRDVVAPGVALPDLPTGLRRPVTERARPTLERLLLATIDVLDRCGLAGTSVNQIAAEAGVAHGSFYAYWTDRTAVFITLVDQAVTAACAHLEQLAGVGNRPELAAWLDGWAEVVRRHGTVLHVWSTEAPDVPELRRASHRLLTCLRDVGTAALQGSPAVGDAEPRAALAVLWMVLTELPYEAWRHRPVLSGEEMSRVQLLLLARGLFGWSDAAAP